VKYHKDDWISALYFREMVMNKLKEKSDDQYERSSYKAEVNSKRNRTIPKKMQTRS